MPIVLASEPVPTTMMPEVGALSTCPLTVIAEPPTAMVAVVPLFARTMLEPAPEAVKV